MKKECYPDSIKITDISVKVPMQNLLNHIAERIHKIKTQKALEKLYEQHLLSNSKWNFVRSILSMLFDQR